MKVRTILLTLSLMTNVLTASESSASLTQNEGSETRVNSLMQYLKDQDKFSRLINDCKMPSNQSSEAEEVINIRAEERKARAQNLKLKNLNTFFKETQENQKFKGSICDNVTFMVGNCFGRDYSDDDEYNPLIMGKLKEVFKFYSRASQIMFSSILKREIWKIFEEDFGGDFSSDKLAKILYRDFALHLSDGVDEGYSLVKISFWEGNEFSEFNSVQEAVNEKSKKEINKLLDEILGENSQNLEKMQSIVNDLFSKGDPKCKFVEIVYAKINIIKAIDCFNENSYVMVTKKPETNLLKMALFVAESEQRFISTVAHELGHVLQEMDLFSKYEKEKNIKNNFGKELISLCFEQSACLLGYVEKEAAYNELKDRLLYMLREAKNISDDISLWECNERGEIRNLEGRIDLTCYGVPFVMAINRAVKLQANNADKVQIMNESLQLANSGKLCLRNLDSEILNKELSEFRTSFDKYLEMIEKNQKSKTE